VCSSNMTSSSLMKMDPHRIKSSRLADPMANTGWLVFVDAKSSIVVRFALGGV